MFNSNVLINAVREVKQEGKPSFVALDVVQLRTQRSKVSGKDYIATVKASITTNLSKALADTMVGQAIGGRIEKQDLPAEKHRDWTNPRTQEKVRITTQNVWVAA